MKHYLPIFTTLLAIKLSGYMAIPTRACFLPLALGAIVEVGGWILHLMYSEEKPWTKQ